MPMNEQGEALAAIPREWANPPEEILCHLERKNRNTGETVILDYLDHAQTRLVLTLVDPFWYYDFNAYGDDGLPRVRQIGETVYIGITLTVCGKSFPGIGSAQTSSPDVLKELIGDALRNAAMTFGIALGLWSKAEMLPTGSPLSPEPDPPAMSVPEPPSVSLEAHRGALRARIENLSASAKGTLRGSMASRRLSLLSAGESELDDIDTLITATELGEAERLKLEKAREKGESEYDSKD